MTVATLTYGRQKAPWDSPLSFGVQAFIEYNGYVLNDRHQTDRIRVTSITGLDDADVTDSREVIPGDDGEIPYDAYYRGRSIVLSGRIEAGSLGVLKRLERDLKAAWAPLVESPLKFRWFDVTDTFDDPQTMQNYTAEVGAQYASQLIPTDGVLRIYTQQPVMMLRTADNRLWGDKQVALRVISGFTSTSDASLINLIVSYQNAQNYCYVQLAATTISTNVVIAGVTYQLSSQAWSGATQGQSLWLRGRTEGNLVTAELWLTRPQTSKLPNFSTYSYLQGPDADALGDQVLTLVGFGADTVNANWAVDDFKIESLDPGDVVFNVRKMPNGMSIKDSQDSSSYFTRQFQITCRASQSFAAGATQSRSVPFVPSSLYVPTSGFSLPLTMPLTFSTVINNAPANTFVTINNRGTVPVRPQIYIYGEISSFVLLNLENGMEITWDGTLADGDYLVFDCLHRTLVNSLGANQLEYFASSSAKWMVVEPGQNDIYLVGSNYSANTKMVVYWNHGWA